MTLCSPFGTPVAGFDCQALQAAGPTGPQVYRLLSTCHFLADSFLIVFASVLKFCGLYIIVTFTDAVSSILELHTAECDHVARPTPPPTPWNHNVVSNGTLLAAVCATATSRREQHMMCAAVPRYGPCVTAVLFTEQEFVILLSSGSWQT